MKKLLSILSICILFVSCTSGTSEEVAEEAPVRLLYDELINKGTNDKPTMYFEGKLFTGVGFDVYDNGDLVWEANYEDGKLDGLYQSWYDNGQLFFEVNYKDGYEDGLAQYWYSDGGLDKEEPFKDGKLDGVVKIYNSDAQSTINYMEYWRGGEFVSSTEQLIEEVTMETVVEEDIY